jgi:site-specific recombinase XerD
MDLLHHGIDRAVIALWLGHESVETVEQYSDRQIMPSCASGNISRSADS